MMQKDEMPWEGLQFLLTPIKLIAAGYPKDRSSDLAQLGIPLRQILGEDYFNICPSFIEGGGENLSDSDRSNMIEEVKQVLGILKVAETSESDMNNKIASHRGKII